MARHPQDSKERTVCLVLLGDVRQCSCVGYVTRFLFIVWRCADEPAPMELVPVGRISALPRRVCQLPFFARFPVTRDVPWPNFLLFAIGGAALFVGFRRAFGRSQQYRGKIAGPILGTLSLLAVGFFCYIVFYMTRQLPGAAGAPHVGQKAPEFVLPDTTNQPVSLASLFSTPLVGSRVPPKGVVLVFYRGYW